MTNEPQELVDRTASSWNMQYPRVRVEGTETDRAYGVQGFPTTVVVDKEGRVAWRGHPSQLRDDLLKELLGGGSDGVPLLPSRYREINALLTKEEFGAARAEIEEALKRSPGDRDLRATRARIDQLAEQRFEAAGTVLEAGSWIEAHDAFAAVAESFAGMSQAADARELVESLRKRDEVRAELGAREAWEQAERLAREGKKDESRAVLRGLVERFPGTPTARKAATRLQQDGARSPQ